MSNSWLEYPNNSNLFKQSYIKDFLDVSGDLYIRNHNINGVDSDISMNGTISCNSLTLTEGTGAGINSDVQTALDEKQDILTPGTGINISGSTISTAGGNVDTLSVSSSAAVAGGGLVKNLDWSGTNMPENSYYANEYKTGRWGDGVRISDDGNTILVGMPLLDDPIGTSGNKSAMVAYRNINGTWTKLGNHVYADGVNNSIPFQGDLNISADGQYIIHGSNSDQSNGNRGFIAAYKLVENSWVQHGDTIRGSSTYHYDTYIQIGKFMLIVNDGNTIISTNAYAHSTIPYKVVVWDLIGSTWTLRPNSILSMSSQNYWNNTYPSSWPLNSWFGVFKGQVDATEDGNTLIITGKHRSYTENSRILVIDYINGDWVKRPTLGNISGRFGDQVSITSDGNTVAISDGTHASNTGCIYVYDYVDGNWSQRGNIVNAPSGGFLWGFDLTTLSNDGNFVAGVDIRDPARLQISYWSGTSWNVVGYVRSGRRRHDFARDALKFVTGQNYTTVAGSTYYNVEVWGLNVENTNNTDVSGNMNVSGNLDVSGGDIIVSGTTVHNSDIRLKTDISSLTNALEKILKLKPEIYDKKKTMSQYDGIFMKESGFIAQEIWYNIPELRHLIVLPDGVAAEDIQDMSLNRVKSEYIDMYDISTNGIIDYNTNQIIHTDEDGTVTYEDIVDPNDYSDKTPDYASYGWSNKPASINYEGIIAYLVGAIQELKTKIDQQTTEINSLT